MKKITIMFFCIIIVPLAVKSQPFTASSFIFEVNGWYFKNLSSSSFSNSVNEYITQDFNLNITNVDIPDKQPDAGIDLKDLPSEDVMRSYLQTEKTNAYLESYLQSSQSHYKQRAYPWYGIAGEVLGSLFRGTY